MKTYFLNLYYPKLQTYARNVKMAKEFVEKVAGNEYRVIRYGENICSIAFATIADPRDFQKALNDIGEDQFQYLVLEISAVHAGWTDRSVYEWIQSRLAKN